MNQSFKTAMLAAAQLTAAGNLNAATAAIQRALAGEDAATHGAAGRSTGPGSARSWLEDVIDIEARWLPEKSQAGAGETGSEDLRPEGATATGPAAEAKADPAKTAPLHADHATGRTLAGSFSAPAGSREYLLYLPAGTPPAAGRPLVVMLHGCTQTPADFAAGTAMNALADRHGFLVLYPAQSKNANQSACWNWFNPRDQRADAGEPSIIAGMVREVLARQGGDPGRVHVAGLSAGGAMAAILADAYPDLFDSVAVHSGLKAGAARDLPSALSAMKRGAGQDGAALNASALNASPFFGGAMTSGNSRPVRTIVFHGRQDRTVHPLNGSQVVAAAVASFPQDELVARQEAGRSPGGRSYTRTVHADAQGRPMVEQWEVQGAGHAWSGGSASGSYTDPIGPDASAAMVDFFFAR